MPSALTYATTLYVFSPLFRILPHALFQIQTCTNPEDNPLSNSLQHNSISLTHTYFLFIHKLRMIITTHDQLLTDGQLHIILLLSLLNQNCTILSFPSINFTFLFSSPQIHYQFLSDHQFCSMLPSIHEPRAHFHKCSHYVK